MFVETLDKCFENVCELDLIFHVDKVRGRGRNEDTSSGRISRQVLLITVNRIGGWCNG